MATPPPSDDDDDVDEPNKVAATVPHTVGVSNATAAAGADDARVPSADDDDMGTQ